MVWYRNTLFVDCCDTFYSLFIWRISVVPNQNKEYETSI